MLAKSIASKLGTSKRGEAQTNVRGSAEGCAVMACGERVDLEEEGIEASMGR